MIHVFYETVVCVVSLRQAFILAICLLTLVTVSNTAPQKCYNIVHKNIKVIVDQMFGQ